MKLLGLFLLLASQALQFEVTDARGKQTSAVTIEAGPPDADGWRQIKVLKAKGDVVLVWPFDAAAKVPDGPEPVPAIVIQRGDPKALANTRTMAAMATPVVLGVATVDEMGRKTGFDPGELTKAFSELAASADPFEKGLGLLYSAKPAEAAGQLGIALKQRERQLTRVPSEICPAALLYGLALFRANKFDASAVAFLTALQQRPSDEMALKYRAEALVKAGKPEAAPR